MRNADIDLCAQHSGRMGMEEPSSNKHIGILVLVVKAIQLSQEVNG